MKIEPANHCLKSCGLPIGSGVATARPPPGAVAAATDQIGFKLRQDGAKSLQGESLRIRPDLGDNRPVQIRRPSWTSAMAKSLMQFPDGITEPGKLEGTKINGLRRQSLLNPDPVAQAASWVKADSRSFTR